MPEVGGLKAVFFQEFRLSISRHSFAEALYLNRLQFTAGAML
jgi:hypothetical protein